jgi:heme/copper-type cytochrome/quinol oxidase subunit 3
MTSYKNEHVKQVYLHRPNFWGEYVKEDVKRSSSFLNLNFLHYFNEIDYTRWPFYLASSLFLAIYYILLAIKGYDWVLHLEFAGIFLVVFFAFVWFRDMLIEAIIFGKYNRKVRAAIAYGFVLFIVSECFFFGGFFWAYFDRLFHSGMYTGNSSLPYGMQPIFKSTKSFIATLLLVSSGVLLNYSVYLIRIGSWIYPYILFFIATIFGIIFLYIQYTEYSKILSFNITQSVYGSLFFFLTGFHGIHVIVGLLFLTVSFALLHNRYFFSRERHLLLMISIFYWHFVDLIWLFLYVTVYLWNFSNSYYHLFDFKYD